MIMDKESIEREYYRVINRARHRVLRIREFCANLKPYLSEEDYYFKMCIEERFKEGVDWLNYGSKWTLHSPKLKENIVKGVNTKELLEPENFVVRLKATNNLTN